MKTNQSRNQWFKRYVILLHLEIWQAKNIFFCHNSPNRRPTKLWGEQKFTQFGCFSAQLCWRTDTLLTDDAGVYTDTGPCGDFAASDRYAKKGGLSRTPHKDGQDMFAKTAQPGWIVDIFQCQNMSKYFGGWSNPVENSCIYYIVKLNHLSNEEGKEYVKMPDKNHWNHHVIEKKHVGQVSNIPNPYAIPLDWLVWRGPVFFSSLRCILTTDWKFGQRVIFPRYLFDCVLASHPIQSPPGLLITFLVKAIPT